MSYAPKIAMMSNMGQVPKRKRRPLDGVLLLDKPKGLSSNGILQRVKYLYRAEKAGHAGTLDPMATGMLPICFGEATKFTTQLLNHNKTYEFTCALGVETDSGDSEGQQINHAPIPRLSIEILETALKTFTGEIKQIPPMVSALHHEGKRLYELARKGIYVERASRAITIYELTLLSFNETSFSARVTCSKGTYVRVLAEDIAKRLNSLGHLTALKRTAIHPYIDDAQLITLETIEAHQEEITALDALLLPMDSAISDLPKIVFNKEETTRILLGQRIRVDNALIYDLYRLYSYSGQFLGVGAPKAPFVIAPKRILKSTMNSNIDAP